MKRFLTLILAVLMIVSCFVGCANQQSGDGAQTTGGTQDGTTPDNTPKVGGKVVVGSSTELGGDFRWPGFGSSSAGAADIDVNGLTHGYSTMETNQGGAYVWNNTVVKSHTEVEDEDGNLVVTIEINPGLKFSDGTEVKAVNYLAYVLAFSSPVSVGAGHPGISGQAFVGFDAFSEYNGTNADEEAGISKEFAGVRLLGDYSFSLTIDAAKGYYPYYYANTYGAVSPYPLDLVLGEGVEVKDDGNGAYLSDAWYTQGEVTTNDEGEETITYVKADHLKEARYDATKYAFSGPYVIKEWDDSKKEATLELNPNYAGNFEGQKPHIQTIVYTKVVSETQLDSFKNGQVDIISGITGGDDTKAALAVVDADKSKYAEVHYQRAGYGKVQFDCDFSPTMFASVRQAIAYVLNTADFAQAFTGGYGTVVYGPYSPDFDQWKAVQDDIELTEYAYSVENAKQALIADGWIYNSKGEAFVEGAEGVDAVRYKKLTAEEAEACDGVNKTYTSVENTDGVEYKTVEINGEYYMPLVINWFGTTPNEVTDMLVARLVGTDDVKALGMVIRSTVGDFNPLLSHVYRDTTLGTYTGTPTYSMYNLATGWNSAIYDYSYNWSLDPAYFDYSNNKLYDEYDVAFPYYDADGNHTKLSYADAVAASGDKLGMDYISFAMVYDATTTEEYNEWWQAYIERWNELMPDIPLYSNYYFDLYNAKIQNFKTSPFFGPTDALLYSWVAE